MIILHHLGLRKYFVIFLLGCWIGILLSCQDSTKSMNNNLNSDMQNSVGENKMPSADDSTISENSVSNEQSAGNSEIISKSNNNSKEMIIIIGAIELKASGLMLGDEWTGDNKDKTNMNMGMTFDILNCAGYIGQARLNKALSPGYWELELIKETVRPDFEQAIKLCAGDEIQIDKAVLASSSAYAVYPSKPERKNIRSPKNLTKADIKALYDSLSPEQKQWRATLNRDYKPELKNTLEDNSFWADSDGDGKVDLIIIDGACDGTSGGELICMKVLHRENGKWKQVARITPA